MSAAGALDTLGHISHFLKRVQLAPEVTVAFLVKGLGAVHRRTIRVRPKLCPRKCMGVWIQSLIHFW